jgi:hypothetical protein
MSPASALALSKGPNRAGVFPFTGGQNEIQFPKRCFLVFRIPEGGQVQNPSNAEFIHHRQKHVDTALLEISTLKEKGKTFSPRIRNERLPEMSDDNGVILA